MAGTLYWEESGEKNTSKTLNRALEAAREKDIKHIIVASKSGGTVKKLSSRAKEENKNKINIVCVTHHVGFRNPGKDEMPEDVRSDLEERDGVDLLTATHVLAGVARSIKNDHGGLYPAEIMAYTLRMLGEGVKVAVEISIMALDAGLIPYGEDVIAIGGTGNGADAACVTRPAHSNNVFDTKVKEILCRPKGSRTPPTGQGT